MNNKIKLDEHQQKALVNIVSGTNKISLLLGSAGRGKSSIVKYAVESLINKGINVEKIAFCTPTGKAALVLKGMLPQHYRPAQTIHSIFGCRGYEWEYDKDNLFDCEYLFLDEASMVGSELMARVIYTVPEECKIVLVADPEQLLPVSAGAPLVDMARAGGDHVSYLVTNYRQKNGELLADVCENIVQGIYPKFTGDQYKKKNAFFHDHDDKEEIPEKILSIIKNWYDDEEDWMCLSPQRTGVCGLNNLNEFLQEELNPAQEGDLQIKVYGFHIRIGDRVRQTKNDYKLGSQGVMNGSVGTVVSIMNKNSIIVDFDGEEVVYENREQINNLVLAYVCTIHSSQGSQYRKVCLVLHSSHSYMLSRSLAYVGVSRSREELHVIGDTKGLKRAIKNKEKNRRNTYLKLRIAGKIEAEGDVV